MDVISTRDSNHKIPAMRAVLKGISDDGGLFVPEYFPQIDIDAACRAVRQGYQEVSAMVMAQYLELDMHCLTKITHNAYDGFRGGWVAPLVNLTPNADVMELFHGPTLAFKDMALQVLPQLISQALELYDEKDDVMVLTATSGDTGKAAMEGFRDVPRTSILVFYPLNGVAPMQKLHMATQEGKNVGVCAVEGNFDDAQNGVKSIFTDSAFVREAKQRGFVLSSANSINFGRLIPQVAYYVYAYVKLVEDGVLQCGDKVNFCVPTGNFGNILAAYYAERMGIPVNKLICASNRNNVLADFFQNGRYDTRREFFRTMSPSMDILVSSNLERLLFELTDRADVLVDEWMKALGRSGHYSISLTMQNRLAELFYADCCMEDETADTIHRTYEDYGYLIDPHTAVAQCVYEKYKKQTGDDTLTVVASTANPYKFPQDVLRALNGTQTEDAFRAADMLSELTNTPVPEQIACLITKPVLHATVAEKDHLPVAVRDFIERGGKQ